MGKQVTNSNVKKANPTTNNCQQDPKLTTMSKLLKKFVQGRRSIISRNAELTLVKAWTDYAEEIEADIRALIPFIDDLQDSADSHDKAILLNRSAFEIYLIRRIRALNPYELLLSDGRGIKMISLRILYGTSLINEMLQFVSRILQLGCTDVDIAMFITIVYYKPRRIEDLASLNLRNSENLSPALHIRKIDWIL
ncbi:hypothetical protein CAEBREN_14746 [Caenorhabditis brenneri]|uniref:NR LBD domain-containing protein n=1 Tax=Caenorhabditis brenneri TaxID=135651 RepID=G0NJW1_CAEBE|nr:hypothetical protein CAEBREN_14746 [Caenorhabditis brenneri]